MCVYIVYLLVWVINCTIARYTHHNGSITMSRRQKGGQWNGIIQILLGRISLILPLQQGKLWPLFFFKGRGGCRSGDFRRIIPLGQNI